MNSTLPELIETERLVIRVARPEDAPSLHLAVRESIAELKPWLGWVSPPPTQDQSLASCKRAYARFLVNEDLMVLLFLKSDGTLVGGSGLHSVNWDLRHFEVGYWGRTGYCGAGLITEAVRALGEHALAELGATRVYLTTDERNGASWRLAERAGFELEGVLRNERRDFTGTLRNTRVYSRIPRRDP